MRLIISVPEDIDLQFRAMAEAQRRHRLAFDHVTITVAEQAAFKAKVGEVVFQECFPDLTCGKIFGIACEVES